jgi:Fe-S-cluster containining protein
MAAYREWFKGQFWFDETLLEAYVARTNVVDGLCVFWGHGGCLIHEHCEIKHLPYYEFKPFVCCLYPLSVRKGSLIPYFDASVGGDETFYRRVREDLRFFFGNELIDELDEMETATPTPTGGSL